ncbi:MAG: hypothetical protein CMM01_00325, partial [Rhodopirellula sp.]|nr:hypothetical protein [Rhodopirellula sp.]
MEAIASCEALDFDTNLLRAPVQRMAQPAADAAGDDVPENPVYYPMVVDLDELAAYIDKLSIIHKAIPNSGLRIKAQQHELLALPRDDVMIGITEVTQGYKRTIREDLAMHETLEEALYIAMNKLMCCAVQALSMQAAHHETASDEASVDIWDEWMASDGAVLLRCVAEPWAEQMWVATDFAARIEKARAKLRPQKRSPSPRPKSDDEDERGSSERLPDLPSDDNMRRGVTCSAWRWVSPWSTQSQMKPPCS